MEMSSRRKLVGPDYLRGRMVSVCSVVIGMESELTIWIARSSSSSSADPPQQLRERKKELILELKDCGGGAVMSYKERECVCVLNAATSSNTRAEMEDDWVGPPWLDEKS